MSKPISISFGKSKISAPAIKGPTASAVKPSPFQNGVSKKPTLLRGDSDDEDDLKQPIHESVTGFAAEGAILGAPVVEKDEVVIKNIGNGDWRKRGRGGKDTPAGKAQAHAAVASTVEKDEVSKASGLQYAKQPTDTDVVEAERNGTTSESNTTNLTHVSKERTEDEVALQALLNGEQGGPKSTVVIAQKENANLTRPDPVDEIGDFRADVASRPDSATLDDYAAMPVEEFGMAMLRGMGAKRRANGEIIKYGSADNATEVKAREPRQGYLGIGAKPSPGAEIELGAWGKTAMRKGMKGKNGEGMYTPVMLKDKRTGEMLTEEELAARKQAAKERLKGKEDDWKERRDRNLGKDGRNGGSGQKRLMDTKDDYRAQKHDSSRDSTPKKIEENGEHGRDRNRSKSKDRRRRDGEERDDKYRDRDRDRNRDGERRRDRHRDDERYESSSSRKSSHREKERTGHPRDDDRRRKERY